MNCKVRFRGVQLTSSERDRIAENPCVHTGIRGGEAVRRICQKSFRDARGQPLYANFLRRGTAVYVLVEPAIMRTCVPTPRSRGDVEGAALDHVSVVAVVVSGFP